MDQMSSGIPACFSQGNGDFVSRRQIESAHRHNAHVFVYVLEGTVVMQLKGGGEETLGPGQTFYESPEDVHAVSRNASKTKPAKFVVFFVKQTGAPPTVPVN